MEVSSFLFPADQFTPSSTITVNTNKKKAMPFTSRRMKSQKANKA